MEEVLVEVERMEDIIGAEPSVVVVVTETGLPVPFALTPLTLKSYSVLPDNPVTVDDRLVDIPSENVDQVEELEDLYSIK